MRAARAFSGCVYGQSMSRACAVLTMLAIRCDGEKHWHDTTRQRTARAGVDKARNPGTKPIDSPKNENSRRTTGKVRL